MRRVDSINDLRAPGDYVVSKARLYGDVARQGVVLACLECGRPMTLCRNHAINAVEPLDVSPSIVCPHPPCTGHYFIRGGVRA